jgi:hypothetical protein
VPRNQSLCCQGDCRTSKLRKSVRSRTVWETGRWLELRRATLRRLSNDNDTLAGALRYLETVSWKTALAKKDSGTLSIERALLASFELLSPTNQSRLTELSIFPRTSPPHLRPQGAMGLDESDTKDAAIEIASSFLLRIDPQSGTMGLHDVLRNWLGRCLGHAPELHSRLIDAWPDESVFFRWNRETTTRQRKVLGEATDAAFDDSPPDAVLRAAIAASSSMPASDNRQRYVKFYAPSVLWAWFSDRRPAHSVPRATSFLEQRTDPGAVLSSRVLLANVYHSEAL